MNPLTHRVLLLGAALALVAFGAAVADEEAPAAQPRVATSPIDGKTGTVLTYTTEAGSWTGEVIQLLWSPRIFLFRGFLSDGECEHLKKIAMDRLAPNVIIDAKTGKQYVSEVRTSQGTFFEYAFDNVVDTVEQRVAAITQLPRENQEGLQVLRYQIGQKYNSHFDFFQDQVHVLPEEGGQRTATVLMYLSTPEDGGETVFPWVKPEYKVTGDGWSECAKTGFAYKPQKGDALLFHSLTPDGNEDAGTLHGSCPVIKGEKWSATKWIRVGVTRQNMQRIRNAWKGCSDGDLKCPEWAKQGECKLHREWMATYCKLSCNFCSSEDTADLASKVATSAQSEEFADKRAAAVKERQASEASAAAAAAAAAAKAQPKKESQEQPKQEGQQEVQAPAAGQEKAQEAVQQQK